jgi:uncharacterized protein (DUF1684 family)
MRTQTLFFAAILLAGAAVAQPPQTPQTVGPNYKQEIEKYRAWRVNDDKTNWATLAGLYWLKPGANTFGTAADNDIVIPKGTAAAHVGKLVFQQGDVRVELEKGIRATITDNSGQAKPFPGGMLLSDHDGTNKPWIMQIGNLQFRVIQRGQRTGLRLKDLANPALKSFHAPQWYFPDPAYHVVATWEPGDGKKKIIVPNILGDATPVTISGTAHFTLNGKPFAIVPVEGDPNKSVEFVFSDETTNKETYPAGRMVDAGPVKDGKIVIDFNEAYNPPCAVTAFATCPIAPKENRLSVPVRAGAKYDKNAKHPGKVFVAP